MKNIMAHSPKNLLMIKRLQEHMQKSGINARELALQANVGPSFIYDILRGKSANPTIHKLSLVAEVLGVTVPYLLAGIVPAQTTETKSDDIADIAGLHIEELPDGRRVIRDKDITPGIIFRKSWIVEFLKAKPADIRMLRINGDNMQSTLLDGDIILLNFAHKTPSPPGIFLLFDGMGLVVKRLEYIPDSASVRVISDNPKYTSYDAPVNEINIIGRVVWFGRGV